ncbi:MAG TPA: helix-turn-helix domain-containing protein [Jatrophihabitans sp.]
MAKSAGVSAAPDLRLPRRWIEGVLPSELPQIAREISRRVQSDIPEYRWAAEAGHTRTIRESTEKALVTFVTQIFRTGEPTVETEAFFRELGRSEATDGRSLEALLAAFRLGALIAWRRIAAAAERNPLPSDIVARLAELVFSFADRLAQLAADGFADGRAEDVDGQGRLRTRLVRMILNQPTTSPESITELAVRVGWPVPDRVLVMELKDILTDPGAAFGPRALVDPEAAVPLVVLPAPVDVVLLAAAVAATGGRAVVGCTVSLVDAPKSLRWARLAARLRDEGVLPDHDLVVCDDHVPTLLLHAESGIGAVLVARRLQPLCDLPLARRLKFARLLAAWLEYGGSQADLAQTMNAHRQTVHYRVGRLQAMFGSQLADRDARLEILLALRWALPRWQREAAG